MGDQWRQEGFEIEVIKGPQRTVAADLLISHGRILGHKMFGVIAEPSMDGLFKSGERVVVIGGGPIGLMIGLLARRVGGEVLVLEVNPFRQAFARKLGFTVSDPNGVPPVEILCGFKNAAAAEVVFEASGSVPGARLMTALAGVHGRLIVVGIQKNDAPFNLYEIFQRELSLQGVRAYTREDFREAIRLLADAELDLVPFITQRYPLARIQQALELTQAGTGVMKIIIQLD